MTDGDSDDGALLIVFCTVPTEGLAEQIAKVTVGERLAACVHVFPQGMSYYHWEGKIHSDKELTLLFKTTRLRYPRLEEKLLEMHPYDTPEIIVCPVTGGVTDYLTWVRGINHL